jgi:hypothetical protein
MGGRLEPTLIADRSPWKSSLTPKLPEAPPRPPARSVSTMSSPIPGGDGNRPTGFALPERTLLLGGARRMCDTAAYLVDRLLPEVPYRQWLPTVPWVLRYRLSADRKLVSRVLDYQRLDLSRPQVVLSVSVGASQGSGSQGTPSPMYVPPISLQIDSVSCSQLSSLRQQAPEGEVGHGR